MKKFFFLFFASILLVSCGTPQYLPAPTIYYPIVKNVCTFNVENFDHNANIEQSELTAHYKDFDVQYSMKQFTPSITIINNSNKSLIIDKSKSFVLYDGYSTQLFKDVRSLRSTTYNNVQDAITNVQSNDASISMSIPPYSKWKLPIEETNVKALSKLPDFNYEMGLHSLSPLNGQETVEFVIPYSYDYSGAKWNTCRNRIYIGSNDVRNESIVDRQLYAKARNKNTIIIENTANNYTVIAANGEPDYTEANRIDRKNAEIYRSHNANVRASHMFWGFVTLPSILGPWLFWKAMLNCDDHVPQFYGNNPPQIQRNDY